MTVLRRALVIGVSADHDFAAGTFLLGFLRHNPDFDGDLIVFHDGLGSDAITALQRVSDRIVLRRYDLAQLGDRLSANGGGLDDPAMVRCLKQWHPMIFAKLELPDLLADYDSLLWCDVDILVQDDISALWKVPVIGWRPLPDGAKARRAAFSQAMQDLVVAPQTPFLNGGVIAMGRALRDLHGLSSDRLYAMTVQIMRRTALRALDELTYYLAAAHYPLPVQELGMDYNHPVTLEGGDRAKILHAIGADKFWNATPLVHACPDWWRDHQRWRDLGGPAAPTPTGLEGVHPLAPDLSLAYARNRAFWGKLWLQIGPQLPQGIWPDLHSHNNSLRLYEQGYDTALRYDIARSASAKMLRVGLFVDKRALGDDGLLFRLDASLADSPYQRKDGRRLREWTCNVPLADLIKHLETLQNHLRKAGRP